MPLHSTVCKRRHDHPTTIIHPFSKTPVVSHNTPILTVMAEARANGERDLDPNFTADSFVTRRDPVQQLVDIISSLYLDSGDEREEDWNPDTLPLLEEEPLPPPEEEDEESLISVMLASRMNTLERNVYNLEGEIMSQIERVLQKV